MPSPRTWTVIHHVYDTVHVGLWALLCAGLIFLPLFVAPKLSQHRSEAQARLLLEITAENRFYCERWGMRPGTQQHATCALDLQELRGKIERRIADDLDIF